LAIPKIVTDNAPTLIYSKGEKYYPCDLFFSGEDVVNNKQKYDEKFDKLETPKKLEDACCYYHVTEGKSYTALQYWYYYANNFYPRDNHEHDFECVKIFVSKKTGLPSYVNCNIHFFNKVVPLKDGKIPDIKVDVGSHAMLPDIDGLKLPFHNWIWHGVKDAKHRTPPKKDMEDLRQEVMVNTDQVMDSGFKIIGDDYDLLGRFSAPIMPWVRIEYYFPENSLKAIKKTAPQKVAIVTKQGLAGPSKGRIGLAAKVPAVEKAVVQKEMPSVEFFLGSKAYAYILDKAGISSINDLSKLSVDTIRSKMKVSAQKEGVGIEIPPTAEVARWKEQIVKQIS
jgi:hypothetical protein